MNKEQLQQSPAPAPHQPVPEHRHLHKILYALIAILVILIASLGAATAFLYQNQLILVDKLEEINSPQSQQNDGSTGSPLEEEAQEGVDTSDWPVYSSSLWQESLIKFKCPPDWEFKENQGSERNMNICESPQSSLFIHISTNTTDVSPICEEGISGEVYIEGNNKYKRHFDEQSEQWIVCAFNEAKQQYEFSPFDGLRLYAPNEEELVVLDAILKSVEGRLN